MTQFLDVHNTTTHVDLSAVVAFKSWLDEGRLAVRLMSDLDNAAGLMVYLPKEWTEVDLISRIELAKSRVARERWI
jgi:hypothetical protein